MKTKILIIDDEMHIVELLKFNLEVSNYEVDYAYDGFDGFLKMKEKNPDLILLDWMLPGISGIEMLKKIRSDKTLSKKPVIMLTAKNMENDKIEGLHTGADDYITKPFTPKLLVIKLKKIFKLGGETFFKIKDISFDFNTFNLTTPKGSCTLPRREAQLLEFFLRNQNIILSRETLLNEVWGFEFFGDERAVDTIVKRLRKKLEDYEYYIKSIRGVGYVFKTD